ncbi:MAG TPA: enoyl-CoA hydratase-related protein [Aggregatilineales bacterium]|nr:enoyl-CoA hydratase-related protein [Aggregatilineales bacterium]
MSYENIIVEVHDRAGLIRLNRPDALNALTTGLMAELADALAVFDADPAVGAVVITGSERAFAAGADIKEMASASAVDMLRQDYVGGWNVVAGMNKPVIAAVSGYALGGGFELALMCDMIVASESAVFGLPEVNLGVMPGAGGTQRLVRAVGKALAMEMILNDRRLKAEDACRFGLVNHIYPADHMLEEALKLANQIAARAPLAVQLAREAINKAFEMTLAEGLEFERRSFYFLFSTQDQKEGMDAFVEKRPPEWKGE